MYSFSAYMAVRTTDKFNRNMLTYCCLIISTTRCIMEGRNMFQLFAVCEVNATLPWNSLLPDLQVSTTLSQRQQAGLFCVLCHGVIHSCQQCALSSSGSRLSILELLLYGISDVFRLSIEQFSSLQSAPPGTRGHVHTQDHVPLATSVSSALVTTLRRTAQMTQELPPPGHLPGVAKDHQDRDSSLHLAAVWQYRLN